jgi:hypothetical protein
MEIIRELEQLGMPATEGGTRPSSTSKRLTEAKVCANQIMAQEIISPDQYNPLMEKSLFCCFLRNKGKHPRKEYVRIKIFRGFKKFLRQISKGKVSAKPAGQIKAAKLDAFVSYYRTNFHSLQDISAVEGERSKDHKSLNTKFLSRFFRRPVVRISFVLFVDYLFCDDNIEMLTSYFRFKCCPNSGEHTTT